MWRRGFLFCFAILAAGGCVGRSEEAPADGPIERGPRPFVLVTLDTTRADRLQPYGATDIATPTLLSLAREGVVFEQAMSVAPITLVAHTSLLTGLYPPRHGVRNNGIHFAGEQLETLAEQLGAHGYGSAAFISASVLEARYGLDQGFDLYDDDLSTGTNRQPRVVPDRNAGATVDAAVAWLDAWTDGRPFFLWVHFYDPHAVYSPPAPYRDRYRDRLYDGEIAYMDAELGRLLKHPALTDAAVAVIGDHGESLGEHGEQTHAILAYQSTLHVPFILRIPDGPAGVRVAEPVSHVDLLPTALDLLGLPPEPVDGRSLLPLLEASGPAEAGEHYAETYLPFYTYGWAKLRVLRSGEWKLIDGPDPELYNLSRDVGETRDLGESEPEVLETLRRQLAERLGDDTENEATLELDEEALQRLRSLGYLASGRAPAADGPRPDPKASIDLHVGLERARVLLRERRPEDAERQLRRVLERDGSNLAALFELSAAKELQGDTDGAVEAAERALALDPGDPRLHVLIARLEQRRDRPGQALELLDAALALDPRHFDARLERIALLSRLGRRAEAARGVETLHRDEGDHPRVLVAQAHLLEPAAAEPLLRRALDADPYLIPAWRSWGRQLEQTGRPDDAASAYRSGLERAPDDPELHALLGRLLARTGGDAEIHLREALRLSLVPRPEVKVALGAHLAERGQLREALELYDEVLDSHPDHLGARNNRAVALYRSGRADEALDALGTLAREHPTHADAHNNLAALSLDRGLWSDAAGHARRALATAPGHANAWLNLGLARDGEANAQAAEEAYGRALEIDPDHTMARFHLGRLYSGDPRRLEQAAELLRQVSADVPSFVEPHLLLGELYAGALDDPRRARAHLNAFVRLSAESPAGDDPRLPEVRRLLGELSLRGGP